MKANTLQTNGRDLSWRPLMAAVIAQAVTDAQAGDLPRKLDAVLFLTGDDIPLWLEACGTPDFDALELVTSGRAKRARRLKDNRKADYGQDARPRKRT